ncbi:MAG: PEP-CTERM sorting domain-containing protein [Pirellulales bacterium]|nr:PEP-CTERM sorting domain-containing protein [Pirellulales bacterium]
MPEPSTIVLLTIGLVGLLARTCQRQMRVVWHSGGYGK